MPRPVLDHSRILNVHRAATGYGAVRPEPGMRLTNSSVWRYRDGSSAGTIGYTAEYETEDSGRLTLEYRLNGEPVRQEFVLIGRPCRFGGRRWLAVCPRTGRAVAKLYGCCGTFQPRHLLRGSYHSQGRVQPAEKLRDREVTILRRLGAGANDDSPIPPAKPKWMRWPTYERLVRELEWVRNAYGLALAREFFGATGIDLKAEKDPADEERVRRLAGRFSTTA